MRRGAFGILMLAVIRPHSTIFQYTVIYGIVISIRSEQYTDAIGIPATALYYVGVRITVDMLSAQYRSINCRNRHCRNWSDCLRNCQAAYRKIYGTGTRYLLGYCRSRKRVSPDCSAITLYLLGS